MNNSTFNGVTMFLGSIIGLFYNALVAMGNILMAVILGAAGAFGAWVVKEYIAPFLKKKIDLISTKWLKKH